MSEARRCPQCGTELAADSPAGLCPACLLRQGLENSNTGGATVVGGGFVPPAPADLGRHFPSLDVLELLGRGGMGAVYKARQKGLDRLVALKIMPPEVARDPAFAERFAREARALARLGHPNIVTVYDFGQTGELYYFVMEYVDGTNLRHLIQTGELSPQEALAVVPQICEALQFAHDEGIVHRDIKPENILVDKRGRVKIADFGLAKLLGRMPTDVTLTQAQQVMGTLNYMAPEQMQRPLEVDHRADIYSLGVVFYEMLTRELPLGRFELPSKKVEIDVRLDDVVMRALERQPERRYQHASEVKSEVETICQLSPAARQRIYGHEFRSRITIAGWPLVHISFGIDPRTGKTRVAKGVIAIGDVAVGLVAIGGAAMGLIAFGGAAFGLLAVGGLGLGILVSAGVGVGGFAFAGMALGLIAIGALAIGFYAAGAIAWGVHALGSNVRDAEAMRFFLPWAEDWSKWLAGIAIGMPVLCGALWGIVWLVFYVQKRNEQRRADQGDRGPRGPAGVREEVRGPAIGLLMTGIVNWIAVPLTALVIALVVHEPPPQSVLAMVAFAGLAFSGFILFGALKMMRLEAYWAAIVASILAMIVTPGNLIGLPIGIWSLVVLSSRQTREAFGPGGNEPPVGEPGNGRDTLLGLALWLVSYVFLAGVGLVLLLLGLLLEPAGSDAWWWYLSGAFAATVGGIAGAISTSNRYLRRSGRGDLTQQPGWFWLDTLCVGYALLGIVAVADVLLGWWPFYGLAAGWPALGLGGIALFQGAALLIWRSPLWTKQPPPVRGPALDRRLLLIAASIVFFVLMAAAGLAGIVAAMTQTPGTRLFWGLLAGGLGALIGGVASLVSMRKLYRDWLRGRTPASDGAAPQQSASQTQEALAGR